MATFNRRDYVVDRVLPNCTVARRPSQCMTALIGPTDPQIREIPDN